MDSHKYYAGIGKPVYLSSILPLTITILQLCFFSLALSISWVTKGVIPAPLGWLRCPGGPFNSLHDLRVGLAARGSI